MTSSRYKIVDGLDAYQMVPPTQGPRGLAGPSEPQGSEGKTGPQGLQGLKGDTGQQGPQGVE